MDEKLVILYKDDCISALKELRLKRERSRHLLKDSVSNSTKVAKNEILPLLCEYYVSLHAYMIMIKGFVASGNFVSHGKKKVLHVSGEEAEIIKALQTVITACEDYLNQRYNMSLSVH